MGELPIEEILAGGGGLALLVGLLAAFLFGANTFAKPKREKRPGRPERPEDPPRPDTRPLDREEAVADYEAAKVERGVANATDEADTDEENPHGLADLVNRLR